jgi:hypothetical protein
MLAVSKDAVDGLELVDNLATGRCAKGVPAGVSPKDALPVVRRRAGTMAGPATGTCLCRL